MRDSQKMGDAGIFLFCLSFHDFEMDLSTQPFGKCSPSRASFEFDVQVLCRVKMITESLDISK